MAVLCAMYYLSFIFVSLNYKIPFNNGICTLLSCFWVHNNLFSKSLSLIVIMLFYISSLNWDITV